jgi:hypothetical protein
MPNRLCPQCRTPGRLLPASSSAAYVNYYRCHHCGQVWAHEKSDASSKPKLINYTAPGPLPERHSDRPSPTLVIDNVVDVIAVGDELCRYCAKPARFLPHVSRTVGLDYYTCDACGYFWCIDNPHRSLAMANAPLARSGLRRFLAEIFGRRRS